MLHDNVILSMDFDPSEWEQQDYDELDLHTPSTKFAESTKKIKVQEKLLHSPMAGRTPSQVCFYGDGCTHRGCNRMHLADTQTPCLYGPGCNKEGCTKIHPCRLDVECRYDAECKLSWCRYVHTKDLCRHGSECTIIGCKYVHST